MGMVKPGSLEVGEEGGEEQRGIELDHLEFLEEAQYLCGGILGDLEEA